MEKILKLWGITWFHVYDPNLKDVKEIKDKFDLHEIIQEDISDINTQAKIDVYDDCMFLVMHFPKFNNKTKTYFSNEFNIILWKDFIVSITKYKTNHVDKIRSEFVQDLKEWKEDFKISPYYLLYVMIDVMYDKVLSALNKFKKDLGDIESSIFRWKKMSQSMLEQLLIKKWNGVSLLHMMSPHDEILDELNKATLKKYGWELDVYFEDLQYKQDKVIWNIDVLNKNIETLSDTYNSLMSIRTNSMISVLTIVTVIFGVMTFLTGLYGMNVNLPLQQNGYTFGLLVLFMLFIWFLMLFLFKKRGRL